MPTLGNGAVKLPHPDPTAVPPCLPQRASVTVHLPVHPLIITVTLSTPISQSSVCLMCSILRATGFQPSQVIWNTPRTYGKAI